MLKRTAIFNVLLNSYTYIITYNILITDHLDNHYVYGVKFIESNVPTKLGLIHGLVKKFKHYKYCHGHHATRDEVIILDERRVVSVQLAFANTKETFCSQSFPQTVCINRQISIKYQL